MGNSRGRWEGDKVVVETTNFTDKTHFRGSFDGRHMVERYTRVDANTVNYEFTVEDPSTWEKPWSAAYPLRSLGSLMDGVDGMQIPQMFEYACHEGNYGLTGRPRFLCCVILAKSEHFLDESDESDKEESLMHPRLPVTIAVLALLGSITLCATQSAAQSASPSANTVTTPWGDPDLQGVWDFRTITPLERPDELAGKAVLTEEEAAEWQRDWANEQNRDRRDGAGTNEVASDGRSDVARAYNEFWWDRGTDIVSDRRTSLIVDPPDGRIPALSPEGERKAEIRAAERRGWTATDIDRRGPADGPENRGVSERCILGFNSGPPMIPSAYNNNVRVVQAPGYVVLLNEMVHNARIVPLDDRPRLPNDVRQWVGDSRGRWDGTTLVVDTRNFTSKTRAGRAAGSAENLHLVERFTRVDADTLLYEFTYNDETTWARPWTAAVPMKRSDDQLFEYSCHEGNYGMTNLLAGARAEERVERNASTQAR